MKVKQNVKENEKIFWNMVGSMSNALSTMILLIAVNRICGTEDGGVFSLGHAVGQQMLTIGTFEVRNYQSTDIKHQFRFGDYLGFRILSCLVMIVVSFGYVYISGYSPYKSRIALLICIYRMVDAFSDVFQGLYQQNNRIDISGKMLSLRVIASSISFVIALVISRNLMLAVIAMDIVAVFCCLLYDVRAASIIENLKVYFQKSEIWGIFKECVPLFVGAFVMMYIVNEPKYAIEAYLTEEIQNVFGIIFMPAFVINLFSLFVFRPMITKMAIVWENSDIHKFVSLLAKALGWCILVTFAGIAGAALLGIPILEIMYGLELNEYKTALLVIMLGGGGNALSTVLRYTLTVVREQYKTLWAYVITLAATLLLAPVIVPKYAIMGASVLYAFSMIFMAFVLGIILFIKVRQTKRIG